MSHIFFRSLWDRIWRNCSEQLVMVSGDLGRVHRRHSNERLWEEEKQKTGRPRFQGWSYEEDEGGEIKPFDGGKLFENFPDNWVIFHLVGKKSHVKGGTDRAVQSPEYKEIYSAVIDTYMNNAVLRLSSSKSFSCLHNIMLRCEVLQTQTILCTYSWLRIGNDSIDHPRHQDLCWRRPHAADRPYHQHCQHLWQRVLHRTDILGSAISGWRQRYSGLKHKSSYKSKYKY